MEYIKALIEVLWGLVTIPINMFGFSISIFNVLVFAFLCGSLYKLIFGGNGGNKNE